MPAYPLYFENRMAGLPPSGHWLNSPSQPRMKIATTSFLLLIHYQFLKLLSRHFTWNVTSWLLIFLWMSTDWGNDWFLSDSQYCPSESSFRTFSKVTLPASIMFGTRMIGFFSPANPERVRVGVGG